MAPLACNAANPNELPLSPVNHRLLLLLIDFFRFLSIFFDYFALSTPYCQLSDCFILRFLRTSRDDSRSSSRNTRNSGQSRDGYPDVPTLQRRRSESRCGVVGRRPASGARYASQQAKFSAFDSCVLPLALVNA